MDYDEQYSEVEALFGTSPERSLERFSGRLKRGSTVLDIGAGQGRNALFLARRGITVHALEPSGVAAAELAEKGDFGKMVALQANDIVSVPLKDAVNKLKTVDDDMYGVATEFFG